MLPEPASPEAADAAVNAQRAPLVLDTNIVLDAWLFNDARTQSLKQQLGRCSRRWLATVPMREELARVLAYPQLRAPLAARELDAPHVLAQFDALAYIVDVARPAGVRCRDPEDQKFVDLAVAHRATLLSRDRALLCLAKRLRALDVRAQAAIDFVA